MLRRELASDREFTDCQVEGSSAAESELGQVDAGARPSRALEGFSSCFADVMGSGGLEDEVAAAVATLATHDDADVRGESGGGSAGGVVGRDSSGGAEEYPESGWDRRRGRRVFFVFSWVFVGFVFFVLFFVLFCFFVFVLRGCL